MSLIPPAHLSLVYGLAIDPVSFGYRTLKFPT